MSFEILNHDDPKWLCYYERLNDHRRDIFYHPGFAKVCQNSIYHNYKVQCGSWISSQGVILYPFVLRKFSITPNPSFKDITGLYGRGGMTIDIDDPLEINAFHDAFRNFCLEQGIICAFDRLHPVMKNYEWIDSSTKLINIGDFVVLDLRNPHEQIEQQFKHMHRKSIKKAERAGVRFFYEQGLDHLEDFIDIYQNTININKAQNFYYFPKEFYENLATELSGKFVFFYAEVDGCVVSCELVLMDGLYSHSYLGGTLPEYRNVCPNAFLKREMIRNLKDRGIHYYLIGGGIQAGDGIFRYKIGFAPKGAVPSHVGCTIYDTLAYQTLKENLISQGHSLQLNHFQFYDHLIVDQ